MKKKQEEVPRSLEDYLQRSYQHMVGMPTYCRVCGHEILPVWTDDLNRSDKPWDVFQQECLYEMHTECAAREYGRRRT